jgi:hypothetical protein
MRKRDQEKKEKMKKYADSRQHAKTNDLKIGDAVLVRQPKKNKLSTPFNPEPFVVEAWKGTLVTARRGSQKITRNVSFFKKIDIRGHEWDISERNDDDDDDFFRMINHRALGNEHNQELAPLCRSQRQRKLPNRFGF